ncbi:MAG: hypothetical protein KAW46_10965 [candidate division Zixibacteria bacterium]|nr:hypothetical protein [candidate division Zixibacteria bacterium]
MKKYLVILGCLAAIIAAFGCQSDIILPPDVDLVGTYTGTYAYITDYAAPDQKSISEYVIFIFDETVYHMNLDTTQELENCFCAVDGLWKLTEGVELREDNSGPEEGCEGACNDEMNPEGIFVREIKDDSLILKMQDGTTLKMLRLLKISD